MTKSRHLALVPQEPTTGLTVMCGTGADPASTLLHLSGELDIATAPQVATEVAEQIDRGRIGLRLDLSALTFCDAAGLAALVRAQQQVALASGTLTVLRPTASFRQLVSWCEYPTLLAT